MAKLSALIAEGKEIQLSNGKGKDIVMRKNKDGWLSEKAARGKGGKKGSVLKEDAMMYVKRLYGLQYKITSPSGVELDWQIPKK
jgi:hypothetical protein